MFQKIKPCKNCCWVKFKPPYNAIVLLIGSDLLSICGIRGPPEKSGLQVAKCIAVHSKNLIWRPTGIQKTDFKQRGDFVGGDLSCFRGTTAYTIMKIEE